MAMKSIKATILLCTLLIGCGTSPTATSPSLSPSDKPQVQQSPTTTPRSVLDEYFAQQSPSVPPTPVATGCDLRSFSVRGAPQFFGRYTTVGLDTIWIFPTRDSVDDILSFFVLINVAKDAPGRFYVAGPEAILQTSLSPYLSQAIQYGYQLPGESRVTPVPPTGLSISPCSPTYLVVAIRGWQGPGTYTMWLPMRLPEGNAVAFSARMQISGCSPSPNEGSGYKCQISDISFGIPSPYR